MLTRGGNGDFVGVYDLVSGGNIHADTLGRAQCREAAKIISTLGNSGVKHP